MATYKLPTTDTEFTPHPAGQHQGFIAEIDDKGMVDTQYGEKHKLSIKIESTTAMMEGGDGTKGYGIWQWATVSGHERSALTTFRKQVLGRDLTPEERQKFDADDYIGKRVGYVVVHVPASKDPSKIYANIQAVWPLEDASEPASSEAIDTIVAQEEVTGLDNEAIQALRAKHLGGKIEDATADAATRYLDKLKEFNGADGDGDPLPF